MKIYFLPMLLSLFFLGACDKNDEIIPEDADENFITSVVMTVDGKSYTADITDNTVTITVPYTVSLNNAEVEFKYTTSATIIPDPETVTDWDNERTFRVTSYNGDASCMPTESRTACGKPSTKPTDGAKSSLNTMKNMASLRNKSRKAGK